MHRHAAGILLQAPSCLFLSLNAWTLHDLHAVLLQVMTNMRPKTYFLRPDVALPMGFALLRELWAQKVSKRPDAYQANASATAA